jgi:hypothetical protein
MAYTQAQTLVDTPTRHVTKRVNVANAESSAVLVNAAALNYALSTLTLKVNSISYAPFKVGETITANAGGTAIVQDVINTSTVIVYSASGTFTNTEPIVGATSAVTRVQNADLAAQTYRLSVARIIFNVDGGNVANPGRVQLEWEGTGGGANNRSIAVLSGSGAYEFDSFGARANNTANTPTGNLLVTTIGWDANTHYTLVVDCSKNLGYAPQYLDRNQRNGY